MSDLFSIKDDFRIVRLNEADAKDSSDHLINLSDLILANEDMYPGIYEWLTKKVIPDLRTPKRVAFVGYINENPVVSAVVKRDKYSKFCHLKIKDDFQNENLGNLFFSLMTLEVRNMAEEIHFTLPESLWEKKKNFFRSFGFHNTNKAGTQYRLFDIELKCSSSFSEVWNAVLKKLPDIAITFSVGKYSLSNKLLMSIHPKYVRRVLYGKKKVEIRRKFTKKWEHTNVCLYSSSPIQALIGEAKINRVVVGEPNYIWEKFNSDIGCSKEEFDKYVATSKEVYAVILDDVRPYKLSIPRSQVSHIIKKDLIPPQSHCSLEKNKQWAEAVSIATLLQASFRNTKKLSELQPILF